MEIEFTDRYGGNYPDPATMCQGDCEGIGRYPVQDTPDLTPHERSEVELIQKRDGIIEDGTYFVRCPDCDGTGLRLSPTLDTP